MHRAKPTAPSSRQYLVQRSQPQLLNVRQKCQSGHDINNPVPRCFSCANLKLARRRSGNQFSYNSGQSSSVPSLNRPPSFTLQANGSNRSSTSGSSNPYQASSQIQTSNAEKPLVFAHLPFFIVEYEIVPPQPLIANKVGNEYQSMLIDFTVPLEFHKGIEKRTHDVQLRIFKEENNSPVIKYPAYFEVRLNKQLAGLNGKLEHEIGTKAVLTEPLVFGQSIRNSLHKSHLIRCQWKNYSNRDFKICLVVVKLLSVDDLFKKVLERATWTEAITQRMVLKFYGEDEELEMQNFKETINCPYGNCRIKVPARSSRCKHVRCFDLRNFITINEKRPVWKCPTCNQEAPFSSIMIDTYFTKVLKALEDNKRVTEIEFSKDGSWKPYTPKDVTDVVLEDSDNEDILKDLKRDLGSSSSGSSSLSGDQQQQRLRKALNVNVVMDPRLKNNRNDTITRFLNKDPPRVTNVAPRPLVDKAPDVITLEDSSDDEIIPSRTPIPAPVRIHQTEVITLSSPEVTPPPSPKRSNVASTKSPALDAPSSTRNSQSQPKSGNLSSSQSRDNSEHFNFVPRLLEEVLASVLNGSSSNSKSPSTPAEVTPINSSNESTPLSNVPPIDEQRDERARSVEAVDQSEFESMLDEITHDEASEFSLQPHVISLLASNDSTTPANEPEGVTPLQVQASEPTTNVHSQASVVSPFEEEEPDEAQATKPKRRGRAPAKAAPLEIRSRRNAPLLKPSIKETTPQAKQQAAKSKQQIELPKPIKISKPTTTSTKERSEVINLPTQQITKSGSSRRKSKIVGAESPSCNVLDVVVIESGDEGIEETQQPKLPAKRGRKKPVQPTTPKAMTRSTTRKQQQEVVTQKSPTTRGRKPKPRALTRKPKQVVVTPPKSPATRGRKRKSTEEVVESSPLKKKKPTVPAANRKQAKPKSPTTRGRKPRAKATPKSSKNDEPNVSNAEPENVKPTIKQRKVRRQSSVILESPRKSSRISNNKKK